MKKIIATAIALVVLVVVAGCSDGDSSVTKQEQKQTEALQKRVQSKVGFPKVDDSLELLNLKQRYELLSKRNKVGYVYLIDHGLIFAEYTVKGKVSSLESQFTNPERYRDCGSECGVTLPQAEPDGSYGENPEGIFFFTTDGVYVEWAGNYQYSDQRREIQQPNQNVLTKKVK